jgi:hypothetical protein
MSTVAFVALVDDHGLVDQRLIHGNVEDAIIQFNAVQGVTTLILY